MTKIDAKAAYALFLRSDWWINLSRLKRRLVGKCHRCQTRHRLQAHHVRYPDNWFDTKLTDLMVLCRDCHEKEHGIGPVQFTVNTRRQRHEFRELRARLLKARKKRTRGAFP